MSKDSSKTPADRKPITIQRLKLKYGDRVDFPGKDNSNAIDTILDPKKAKRWLVEHLPWRRQVRIRHWNASQPMVTMYLPEAWCAMVVDEPEVAPPQPQ